jgi:hypothetical protein
VVSVGSFYRQIPSLDCIEATEETEVFYITRKDYEYLCRTYLGFANVARILLEKYLEVFEEDSRLIRGHRNNESYQMVVDKMPHLINRASVTDMASWLNMSSESLSRIRNSRSK